MYRKLWACAWWTSAFHQPHDTPSTPKRACVITLHCMTCLSKLQDFPATHRNDWKEMYRIKYFLVSCISQYFLFYSKKKDHQQIPTGLNPQCSVRIYSDLKKYVLMNPKERCKSSFSTVGVNEILEIFSELQCKHAADPSGS